MPTIASAIMLPPMQHTYAKGVVDILRLYEGITVDFADVIKKEELERMDIVDFSIKCKVTLTYVAKSQEEFDKLREILKTRVINCAQHEEVNTELYYYR